MANPTSTIARDIEAQPLEHQDMANGSGIHAGTSAGDGESHAAPTALGLNDTGWVGVAALVVLIGMVVWKVPAAIGAMLDKRIAEIRHQLDEAAALRKEAEGLRDEYAARARGAEADAAKMRENARHEAAEIVNKAKHDTEVLMERRTRMAEDKIAAAERSAIAEVRARTAEAAATAAAALIAERHGVDADRTLVDRAIVGVGRLN